MLAELAGEPSVLYTKAMADLSEGRIEFLSSNSDMESDGETVSRVSRNGGVNHTEKV